MVIFTTPTALLVDWVMKLRFLSAQENRATYYSGGSNSSNYVIYSLVQAGETNRDLGGYVMTHQEQRTVKELRGTIDQNLKAFSKPYGFKVVSKCAYKVIDGFLYDVYIEAPPIKCGTAISATISVKPCAIDDVFWEVYDMQEMARKKPLSFHITAAHAPYPNTIKKMRYVSNQWRRLVRL